MNNVLNLFRSLHIRLAFWILKRSMRADPGYAWAWHCNLAMAAFDRGVDHLTANRSAALSMKHFFDIDMTKDGNYQALLSDYGVSQ
jgi:hypothetical protein